MAVQLSSIEPRKPGPKFKLTFEQRVEVLRQYQSGVLTIPEIARQFGITKQTVHNIVNRFKDEKAASPGTDGGVITPEGGSTANDKRVDSTSLTPTEEVEQ